MHHEQLVEGLPVDDFDFNVKNVSDKEIHRGCVVSDFKNDTRKGADSLNVQMIVSTHHSQVCACQHNPE